MEQAYESMIGGLIDHHHGTMEGFIQPLLVAALRSDLLEKFEQGAMQSAGVGQHHHFERNNAVRGDVIYWLEKHNNAVQCEFLERIDDFIAYLNRTCYAGIRGYEFHYALYDTGSFYKRHLDQFKTDSGRKYSIVTYLNADDWAPGDGGQLVLFPEGQLPLEIQPNSGNAVFFRSDEIEHEVKPAGRVRLSIAGWLK